MNKKILVVFVMLVLVIFVTGCSQATTKAETPEPNSINETPEPGTIDKEKSAADDYPNRPITMMLTSSAGGSTDVMGRLLAAKLEEILETPVVVVNKPGAGGWLCLNYIVEEAAPDGYTFVNIATPYNNLGAYDPVNPRKYTIEDFDYLANQVIDYNVIGIRNDETRFNDLDSLIEYAKQETLIIAASGTGVLSDDATVIEYFNKNFDTKFEIVQTEGAKDSETMFISGNSDVLVANVADVLSAYQGDRYKIITYFGPERSELLPDVPTAAEQGVEDFYMYSARGWAFPKGVDPAIREKFVDALRTAINDPEMKEKLIELGAETHYMEGQEYYDFLKKNIEISKEVFDIE
jgi:tripartite-type tricarboxylate transporter receptor subunit TctC